MSLPELKKVISTETISVLMPTYKQSHFITRAIKSLQCQTFKNWELIIINDGSPDNTRDIIQHFLADKRIKYFENERNEGLGYCLNRGLKLCNSDYIAYLPSDDVYYCDHLQELNDTLKKDNSAVLVYAGVNMSKELLERKNNTIQLVQILHKKTDDEWMERFERVSDNYNVLFLKKLKKHGRFVAHDKITCEWVDHPEQRTKIICEDFGGSIYKYKLFYNVTTPIRFQSSTGNYIDEISLYKKFRAQINQPVSKQLKILIVGELAFNADRILALERKGYKLYGLWMNNPIFFNTIGPLPFGNVQDIPYENWQSEIEKIKPDVIYALLNWQTVAFAHEIMTNNTTIPFVWHFKEGPSICIKVGLWKKLTDLYSLCDGQIFINAEVKSWFDQVLPSSETPSYIFDGDLPLSDWFHNERSPLLSEQDGEIHTLIAGRQIGFKLEYLKMLANKKIHIHIYGELYHNTIKKHYNEIKAMMGDYFHIHPSCDQENWIKEFSQYDAGWLHLFDSTNFGELHRVTWDDLNYPARISTLAVAGVPMILKDNTGHLVAMQNLIEKLDIGIPFKDFDNLAETLHDKLRMNTLRNNVWKNRSFFQFDNYVDDLIIFFKEVIAYKRNRKVTA